MDGLADGTGPPTVGAKYVTTRRIGAPAARPRRAGAYRPAPGLGRAGHRRPDPGLGRCPGRAAGRLPVPADHQRRVHRPRHRPDPGAADGPPGSRKEMPANVAALKHRWKRAGPPGRLAGSAAPAPVQVQIVPSGLITTTSPSAVTQRALGAMRGSVRGLDGGCHDAALPRHARTDRIGTVRRHRPSATILDIASDHAMARARVPYCAGGVRVRPDSPGENQVNSRRRPGYAHPVAGTGPSFTAAGALPRRGRLPADALAPARRCRGCPGGPLDELARAIVGERDAAAEQWNGIVSVRLDPADPATPRWSSSPCCSARRMR